jgi:Ca2+-binding EF-hand superfamily protein
LHFSAIPREGGGDEIPLARFSRTVTGLHIDLQQDEIEAIASLFPGELGRVRYQDFVDAVAPSTAPQEASAVEVVGRLRSFLATSFVTLAQSASRFDRENSGVISGQQFASALQFLKFPISPPELAAIRDAYPGRTRGSINWQVLCAEVDRSAAPRDAAPDITVGGSARPLPSGAIGELVRKIGSSAAFVGLDLAAELQAADARRAGLATQETFLEVLKKLPLDLAISEIRPLVSFYRVSGSSNINYVDFVRDIAAVANAPSPSPAAIPAATPPPLPVLPPAVHDLLKRFKSFCVQRRMAPTDVFLPYDIPTSGALGAKSAHVTSGFLSAARLPAAFNTVQFVIQAAEVDALLAAFGDKRRPDLFNYAVLVRAVQAEDIASADSRASLAPAPVTPALEEAARLTAGQIREKLLARHRRIDLAFVGVTAAAIPAAEFQQRLGAIDLVLRSNQIQSLIRRYRVNQTDQIDWKAFVDDVNQSKTVGE